MHHPTEQQIHFWGVGQFAQHSGVCVGVGFCKTLKTSFIFQSFVCDVIQGPFQDEEPSSIAMGLLGLLDCQSLQPM